MTETTLTTGALYLMRGYTRRMTHRLQVAREILFAQGFEPEVKHAGPYADEPKMFHAHRQYYCGDRCKTVWPELATREVFNAAFALADAIQNARSARTAQAVNEYELAKMAAGRVAG